MKIPDGADCKPLIDEFKASGQMSLLWQWTAREFVCSANILRGAAENASLFPDETGNHLWKPRAAVWLLYGLALENLVKGLLVAQGIEATAKGELNKSLKTHDLVTLWERAGLPKSQSTDDILKNLHWSVEVRRLAATREVVTRLAVPAVALVVAFSTLCYMEHVRIGPASASSSTRASCALT
jgi:hypothetical protein